MRTSLKQAILLACTATTHALLGGGVALAGAVSRMAITSAPQTVVTGQCSGATTVQAQDDAGQAATVPANTAIYLDQSDWSLQFYSDPGCLQQVTGPLTMAAGTGTATFYFNSSTVGTNHVVVSTYTYVDGSQDESIVAAAPAPSPSPTATAAGMRPMPSKLYGVTLDAVDRLSDIVTSLKNLSHMPIARVVFDEGVAPSYYVDPVNQITPVSYVMGEILDSQFVSKVSASGYTQRTSDYLNALGSQVDLWEVGNEINGEWLGDTPTVVAKMTGAYDLVKAAGKRTELTLYYNQDCWSNPANEMFTWAQANIPDTMKQNLDYVLVSYYENDCNGLRPDWSTVFQKLGAMFPNSKIGFGEIGTTVSSDKADYVNRYYEMADPAPNYVGGYFWWYYKEDMVPYTNTLWGVLNNAIMYH